MCASRIHGLQKKIIIKSYQRMPIIRVVKLVDANIQHNVLLWSVVVVKNTFCVQVGWEQLYFSVLWWLSDDRTELSYERHGARVSPRSLWDFWHVILSPLYLYTYTVYLSMCIRCASHETTAQQTFGFTSLRPTITRIPYMHLNTQTTENLLSN